MRHATVLDFLGEPIMNTVPFTVDLYGGLGRCEGLLRDEGECLGLEFQIKDSLAGILKSGVRNVRIPLKDLVSVTLQKGWLGTCWLGLKIILQSNRIETLQDVPGSTQARVELHIARRDRDAAEQLVANLYEAEK
jgi:hypothetical protein